MRIFSIRSTLALVLLAGLSLGCGWAQDDAKTAVEQNQTLWRLFLDWREARIEATDSYLLSSPGIAYATVQDTTMTPLVYRSVAFAALAEARSIRPHEVVLATAFFQFASPPVASPSGGDANYLNLRGTVDFAYLWRPSGTSFALGAGLSLTGNSRQLDSLGNSSRNYDIAVSLNPAAEWEYEFRLLGRPTVWRVGATTPVFSWVQREPAFNVSYAGTRSLWAAPWQFGRIRLATGLSRLLDRSDENRLRLDYRYDLYVVPDEPGGRSVVTSSHALTLGISSKTR